MWTASQLGEPVRAIKAHFLTLFRYAACSICHVKLACVPVNAKHCSRYLRDAFLGAPEQPILQKATYVAGMGSPFIGVRNLCSCFR
jgi:hypothetical protein